MSTPDTFETDPRAYAALRESVGSQAKVAKLLKVNIATLSRRENGGPDKPVSIECALALRWLRDNPITDESEDEQPTDTAEEDEGAPTMDDRPSEALVESEA